MSKVINRRGDGLSARVHRLATASSTPLGLPGDPPTRTAICRRTGRPLLIPGGTCRSSKAQGMPTLRQAVPSRPPALPTTHRHARSATLWQTSAVARWTTSDASDTIRGLRQYTIEVQCWPYSPEDLHVLGNLDLREHQRVAQRILSDFSSRRTESRLHPSAKNRAPVRLPARTARPDRKAEQQQVMPCATGRVANTLSTVGAAIIAPKAPGKLTRRICWKAGHKKHVRDLCIMANSERRPLHTQGMDEDGRPMLDGG